MTHICVGILTIIGSDNGLSPGWHQAIIWTNAGILSIWPLGTNLIEILIEILTFSFKKMHSENVVCEAAAILSRPQCVKWNVSNRSSIIEMFASTSALKINTVYCVHQWQLHINIHIYCNFKQKNIFNIVFNILAGKTGYNFTNSMAKRFLGDKI